VEVIVMIRSARHRHGSWLEDGRHGPVPTLHAVPASAPRRPAWMRLYGSALFVLGLGGLATWRTSTEGGRQVIALLMAAALLVAMAAWVRANRVALSRLTEPESGTARVPVRVVHSARHPMVDEVRIVRLGPEEALPPCDGRS
jgi:hypothetical protein